MPPRLSTGSRRLVDVGRDEAHGHEQGDGASGRVTKKTEPQAKCSSSAPESSGPSEAIAPPIADHRAIEWVRAAPDHSAVISASVVG